MSLCELKQLDRVVILLTDAEQADLEGAAGELRLGVYVPACSCATWPGEAVAPARVREASERTNAGPG